MSTLFDAPENVRAVRHGRQEPVLNCQITGLDLAIGATGICLPNGTAATIKPALKEDARLTEIRNKIGALLADHPTDVVVLEDVPATMKGAAGKVIPMLHGAVRAMLLDIGLPYVVVPPSTLKAFATGKGNADKTAMAIAALKRSGREFADDNQVDAAWLRWAGLDWYGQPEFALPQAQRERLTKVAWPDLAGVSS
jgi:Holliday junction resolvasome RuvABC endonuclease subunit